MTTSPAYARAFGGINIIPLETSAWQAIVTEAAATFILIIVILKMAVDQSKSKVGPIAIGFTVTANIYAMWVKKKETIATVRVDQKQLGWMVS